MVKILALFQQSEESDFIIFHIESKLGIDICLPASEAEAIGLFSIESSWEIVLIDTNYEWSSFIKYVKENNVPIVFIPIINNSKISVCNLENLKTLENVPRSKLLARLPILLKDFYNQKHLPKNASSGSIELQFCRIRTYLLLKLSPLEMDVYIRLSNQKFLKIFLKGDIFEKKDLEKYLVQKKINFLYLKNSNLEDFLIKVEKDLQLTLQETDSDQNKMMETAESTIEAIYEVSQKIGFTPALQEVIKTNSKMIMKLTARSPSLAQLFQKFERDKKKYLVSHSMAVAQVACSIAAAMKWTSDATYQKLVLASMVHDITLSNQKLAEIQTLGELEKRKKEFTPEEIQAYKTHPIDAGTIVKNFSELPPDVDLIVTQHHELPEERGFPRKLPALKINPLSCVFIIAHEIVTLMLNDEKFSIAKYLSSRKNKYTSGNFKKIISTLESIQ